VDGRRQLLQGGAQLADAATADGERVVEEAEAVKTMVLHQKGHLGGDGFWAAVTEAAAGDVVRAERAGSGAAAARQDAGRRRGALRDFAIHEARQGCVVPGRIEK